MAAMRTIENLIVRAESSSRNGLYTKNVKVRDI
jgi:hypothetical protein